MYENPENLTRKDIELAASGLGILMWDCPRNGRLIIRPAIFLSRCWPSVINAQLQALKSLENPSTLGVTTEELNHNIRELESVYRGACGSFMKALKAD